MKADKDIEFIDKSPYAGKAMALFKEGYNCAQSVFLAFDDKYSMDRSTALKLSSSFGGGMGRLREVCGAVSGMFMVAGILYGYEEPTAYEEKAAHYTRIQELAHSFSEYTGSIVCRELLGLEQKEDKPIQSRKSEVKLIIGSGLAYRWWGLRLRLWSSISMKIKL